MVLQKNARDIEFKKQQIWTVVSAIPYGCVASYGQIATMAGLPNYARFVGFCLKNLPKDTLLPWHRIINSQGKISFPLDSARFFRQKELLEKEHVLVSNGRVSLKKYQWNV